ncbi:DUF5313 family protein [Blastococcus sp. SYSU D00820]
MRTQRSSSAPAVRPGVGRWLWYALGGGLPERYAPWVLSDTTRPGWVRRHVLRALVQMSPLVVACLLVPVPLSYRLTVAFGGLLVGLLYSVAFMVETTEHRVAKAGYPSGTAARLREERAERARVERLSPYRRDGAGSFD